MVSLFDELRAKQTRRERIQSRAHVKWLLWRMKFTDFLVRVAQSSCMHTFSSVHISENDEYFTVCGQCSKVFYVSDTSEDNDE